MMMWEYKYFELLDIFNELEDKHELLKKEYMALVDECSNKTERLKHRINKHKDDYNKLLEREQNKGWNEL